MIKIPAAGVNMAEKGGKPVPMKLFASWEVDRTPPNCIPRLCTLTLSRLVVIKPMGTELSSLILAVKMQSAKRTLRSNEIPVLPSGLLDTELDLTFSLQYPHFLKREGNRLIVMLQRRKKYKHRAILGFKTLAEGTINMAQVLQRQMDVELELFSDAGKEKGTVLARVTMLALASQPVDHDELALRQKHISLDRSNDAVVDFSDDEDDFSSNEDGSDSEPMHEDGVTRPGRKPSRAKMFAANARAAYSSAVQQRNLKQKFVSLLKRFKITEDLQVLGENREEMEQKFTGSEMDPADIADLFDELDDLSDSGPEIDTMSITSTPKPSLRPFFASSRSLLHETLHVPDKPGSDRFSDESSKKADSDSHPENWTDHEQSDPQQIASSPPRNADDRIRLEKQHSAQDSVGDRKSKIFTRDKSTMSLKEKKPAKEKSSVERSNSALQIESSPRKVVLEQLSRILPPDDTIPDHVILVNTGDPQGPLLASKLQERNQRVLCTAGSADVRAAVTCLVNKIQKFCNSNAKAPPPIKVLIAGSDSYVNSVLRPYVDQLSSKAPDWQAYIKFFIVPLGSNTLAKYLGSIDSTYANTFVVDGWRELLEKAEIQKTDCQEMVNRINRYLNNTASVLQLPIAEAMVTYKEKSSDEESSQIFIPFINEVRIGSLESTASLSVEMDDGQLSLLPTSGSPPGQTSQTEKPRDKVTPPSSPNVNSSYISNSRDTVSSEPLELQLDYWLVGSGKLDSSKKGDNKSTIKMTFRSLQVQRLSPHGDAPSQNFTLNYSVKEKKQKIMRLGKKKEKEKESEPKSQVVEGVSRLICLSKTTNIPLKVTVDGMEWTGVKFFQLSSQWQTHIKHFPVALFTYADSTL